VLERMASEPPRRTTAFPDLKHRAAASTVTFARFVDNPDHPEGIRILPTSSPLGLRHME